MTFNELITKIGVDKILHFSVGGFVVALFTIIAALQDGRIDASTIALPFTGLIPVACFLGLRKKLLMTSLT